MSDTERKSFREIQRDFALQRDRERGLMQATVGAIAVGGWRSDTYGRVIEVEPPTAADDTSTDHPSVHSGTYVVQILGSTSGVRSDSWVVVHDGHKAFANFHTSAVAILHALAVRAGGDPNDAGPAIYAGKLLDIIDRPAPNAA